MVALTARLVAEVLRHYAARQDGWAAAPAGRALADHVICAAAGWSLLGSRLVSGSGGGAHVLGLPLTLATGEAAAANAASAHALDRDDLHWPSTTHAGGVIWPVVLALGEESSTAGADAVRAAAVGYEITARLGAALGSGHRRFWHATTTAGTVGGAAAGALAAGGDAATAVAAAGHATSVAGGLVQTLLERSDTRLFHRSHAARTAVAAAVAALHGLQATREALESPRGFFAAVAPGADPARLLAPAGDGWAIERLTLRPYAASGFTHAAVDAAVELGPVDAATVRGVRITAPPACLALAANPHPTDRAAAWWSVQHAVAVCLLSGDAAALETVGPGPWPEVAALLRATEVRANDDPMALSATVEVKEHGRTRSAVQDYPTGHPDRPLGREQLLRKWSAMLPWASQRDLQSIEALAHEFPERTVGESVRTLAAASWKGSWNR